LDYREEIDDECVAEERLENAVDGRFWLCAVGYRKGVYRNLVSFFWTAD
jgi:hypothetical protein